MKRNKFLLIGVLVVLSAFIMAVIGCNTGTSNGGDNNNVSNNSGSNNGGLSGRWGGLIAGEWMVITITGSGYGDSTGQHGTYIMDGITARLINTDLNHEIGFAVLLDSNTISVTLNSWTGTSGTYRLTRQ
ncbi:MAG: hypothetical protein LBI90_02675 [Treponema sp.]|jgi:hypothetical protein|nr:hypothetical protein [Treponema sp.]